MQKKKAKNGAADSFFKFLAFILCIWLAVLIFTKFFCNLSKFEIVGFARYPDDHIIAVSDLYKGDNLVWKFNPDEVEKRLYSGLIYAETVSVNRTGVDSVKIEITECFPTLAVKLDENTYLIVSGGGKIVSIEDTNLGLLTVTGYEPKSNKICDILSADGLYKDNALASIRKAIEIDGITGITEINLADIHGIKMVYENRIEIDFGDNTEIGSKLSFARAALALEETKGKEGYLFLFGADAQFVSKEDMENYQRDKEKPQL